MPTAEVIAEMRGAFAALRRGEIGMEEYGRRIEAATRSAPPPDEPKPVATLPEDKLLGLLADGSWKEEGDAMVAAFGTLRAKGKLRDMVARMRRRGIPVERLGEGSHVEYRLAR